MEGQVFKLLDFPDEILLNIFANFNDIDLLRTARVCQHFSTIAKETFANKYNGSSKEKYFYIKIYRDDSNDDHKLYREFLKTFGNKIAAINFYSKCSPNKFNIVRLIGQHCRSTKYMTITTNGTKINLSLMIKPMTKLTRLDIVNIRSTNYYWASICYPYLTNFVMHCFLNINVEVLEQFLCINPQLESLQITMCDNITMELLRGKLKRLKYLSFCGGYWLSEELLSSSQDINMERLETLKISIVVTSFRTVLKEIARGSKMIRRLDVECIAWDFGKIREQLYDVIPLFMNLNSLRLDGCVLTVDVTRNLVPLLPHSIVTLELPAVKLADFHSDDILFIFKQCKKLKELVLESNQSDINIREFNSLQFHRELTRTTRNRGIGVKFEVNQWLTKMIVTAEKIILNDLTFYWNEMSDYRSKTHFLDLSDECLDRIFCYLREENELALYETCTRTKAAMVERISKQVFTVSDLNSARDTFRRFGEHITRLTIDIYRSEDAQAKEIWRFIGTNFAEKITELSLEGVKVSAVESLKINFPNLTTLKISTVWTSRRHIFPPMKCPKLSHIKIYGVYIEFKTKALNFGVSFDRLTTIEISANSKNVGKILHLLDDRICDQIQEFTVQRPQRSLWDDDYDYQQKVFANIAMRFQNLTILNFHIPRIERTNTKYLFASCTKIRKLTMGFTNEFHIDEWHQTLQNIKENCKHLEVIQLINDYRAFDEKLSTEIAKTFPGLQFYTVVYDFDYDNDTYSESLQ